MKKQFFLYVLSSMVGLLYSSLWLGQIDLTDQIIHFQQERPYVYRTLIPFLARMLHDLFSIPSDTSIFIIVYLFCILTICSIHYLFSNFIDDENNLDVMTCTVFIFTVFVAFFPVRFIKVYDVPAVFFFTISLGLLARGKFFEYLIIFPLATINRETTFLLTIFFFIYFMRRMPVVKFVLACSYQGIVYVLIKLWTDSIFSSNPGAVFLYGLDFALKGYMKEPIQTLLLFILICIFVFLSIKGWKSKPEFMRIFFVSLFPLQIILHMLMGVAFETRVMSETSPILFFLSMLYLSTTQAG